jgi:sarcosine oxidase subunit beta
VEIFIKWGRDGSSTVSSDYVIVGGGVYGCGTACELARKGVDVTLLEADEVASGASGGLGKRGVRANGRDPRELPLMRIAYDRWPKLGEEINRETGYDRTGHLLLFEREPGGGLTGGNSSAPARCWLQNQSGIETNRLDADGVHEVEPYLSDDIVGALYCPNDGIADHTATTKGLAEAADQEGANVHEGTPAVDLDIDDGNVEAVVTEDGERFAADERVLLLSNNHTARFVEEQFDLTMPVWRILPQVMKTEPLDEVPISHLIGHDSRALAMKKVEGDRIMISGGWLGRWDVDLERGETVPDRVTNNTEDAISTYPVLDGVSIDEADAGRPEGSSVDHIPIIGELPGIEGLVVGTGWTGHGFAISVAVNQLLSEWMLQGQKPELLKPFTYSRFL